MVLLKILNDAKEPAVGLKEGNSDPALLDDCADNGPGVLWVIPVGTCHLSHTRVR